MKIGEFHWLLPSISVQCGSAGLDRLAFLRVHVLADRRSQCNDYTISIFLLRLHVILRSNLQHLPIAVSPYLCVKLVRHSVHSPYFTSHSQA